MQCWLFSGEELFFGGVTFSWHGGEAPWPAGIRVVNIDLPPDDRLGPNGLRLEALESGQVAGWRLVDHEGKFLAFGSLPELNLEFCARIQA